jgi:crossover junction endodeoxyribonuclease RuvC
MDNPKEIILGIDPGYGRMGFGVIEKSGGKDWISLDYGCLETPVNGDFTERLKIVSEKIQEIIEKYQPTKMALKDLFFFKNAKTAIKVGQVRGAMMLIATQNNLPVDEFTPLQVKQAITGYGRAEKKQMQKIVAVILKIKEEIVSDDAADALAVALCAGQSLWIKRV